MAFSEDRGKNGVEGSGLVLLEIAMVGEEMEGGARERAGGTSVKQRPTQAVDDVERNEQIIGCPIDMITTGHRRHESIAVREIMPVR